VQVEERIRKCLECQANVDKPKFEPLKPSEMPQEPWLEVSADFYWLMDDGCYWFVNTCDYSRYVFLDRIKSVAMDHVQPVLVELFTMFGTLTIYKTDNGAPFYSNLKHDVVSFHHDIANLIRYKKQFLFQKNNFTKLIKDLFFCSGIKRN